MKTYIIFSAFYLPHLGGVERYVYNLARKLISKGNKVIIVTSNINFTVSHEIIDGCEVYRLPCINLLNARFPILKINREFYQIIKELRKKEPDFIIVNTRFYIHSLFGVYFAKQLDVPCIVIEHGSNHIILKKLLLNKLGNLYEHIITFFVKRYCNNFYGVSEASNRWLLHFGIQANGTLYNGVDLDVIQSISSKSVEEYKNKYCLNEDAFVITFTGRLITEKGIMKLISAVEKLNENYPNIYLFIAGEGDLVNVIQKHCNNNIIYVGNLEFENVISLLSQTDIFCLPTDYPEGFPTSILEAAACKCFIITSKSGGSKELIYNKDYGIILDNNSPENIYDAIKYVIENPDYKSRAIDLTYQRLSRFFTWDIISEKLTSLVEDYNSN